ncbi:MAG TPA: dTDP-glucose 4,6-dehydratase [Egibacteraceae bacterium]|jgi:dTDP-glucose 4,6-dehydratase|nr:dTDP-glucose 4,6-dehydratase [Egibacteraceae bacterium]
MRIFVTGGAGFIGSNFIRHVLTTQPDVAVTNYDKLTYAGNLANLADLADDTRYAFVRGDINDAALLADVLPGHDAVVNFAAESHVDRSITASDDFIQANVAGANTLFNAAMRVEVERFLHISTDETYGSIPEPNSFVEGDALEPNSPYSASKASADLLARAYRVTYGYPIMVTRTANNFGPYHYPEKVIPLFVTNLIDGGRVPLYGRGANVRDWTYVLDNCAAQWLVLTEGEPGGLYNVGAGNEMSNKALTYAILERFGFTGEEADARIEFVPDRPGHDLRYSVDTTRVRELGWKPEHAFADALDATIAWYRANEEWWRPLKHGGAGARRGLVS